MTQWRVVPVLLAACLLAGCKPPAPADDKDDKKAMPVVQVATVHYGPIEQLVHATGTLSAPREEEAAVSAPVPGLIESLTVRIGQRVLSGQVLAQLSTRTVTGQIQQAESVVDQDRVQVLQAEANALQQKAQSRSAVLQAQSALSAARANLIGARATLSADVIAQQNADRTYRRLKALNEDGLVSQKDLDAADTAVRTAEAQVLSQRETVAAQQQTVESQAQAVEAARAGQLQDQVKEQDVAVARQQVRNAEGALMSARGQITLYTLTAPITGRVIAVGASVGETVDATTKVATVANLRILQLQLAIPSRLAVLVHPGQLLRCQVDGLSDTPVLGRVAEVGQQVDPTSDTVTVRARIVNAGERIANGAYAQTDIVVRTHSHALLVPKAALLEQSGDDARLPIVGEDGLVHQKRVKIVIQNGTEAELEAGVKEGDRVVVQGGYGLPDGTAVKVAAPASKGDG